ncbi:MAG: hypothetical protein ACXVZW_03345 [Gaiellaceae bacterium]
MTSTGFMREFGGKARRRTSFVATRPDEFLRPAASRREELIERLFGPVTQYPVTGRCGSAPAHEHACFDRLGSSGLPFRQAA